MVFFRLQHDIPFMSHALKFNVISGVTFLLAVFFLAFKGLHFNIEFTGGSHGIRLTGFRVGPHHIASRPAF